MTTPEFAPFPNEEYAGRVARARAEMTARGIDALLVTSKENVVYFTGLQTIGWVSKHRPIVVLIPCDEDTPVTMILPESLMHVAHMTSWVPELRPWGGWRVQNAPPDPIEGACRAAQELGLAGKRLGFELGYGQRLGMSQSDYDALRRGLGETTIVDGAEVLWQLRMIKSPREIERLRRACEATTKAFEAGFSALYAGMHEREIAGIMFSRMAAETDDRPGFMMVRSGVEKYATMNVLPFEKAMNEGDLVVVDAGAVYRDYWADFMRMASIGEPTAEQRRFFEATLASQQAGVECVRPGATAHEVFQTCYDVLVQRGLKEHATIERVGHGVGLDMHEPPSLARGSDVVIEEGMVLTVEPVFWDKPHARIGNFALEDVVVVTQGGCELLSLFPKDLYVVTD
jgi:Xaa-Pro aminopeptidase